ncbi:hypothetical protein MYAM1_001085 [Malassezia yamatoensis]|uniref:DUF453-domain-containing protein n=1 Tax=Malassezia yamatoensis TaxID=253288 RepID=A0AAJ5YPV1_9BASI|nr:hypothetical protein MYAM1_001085 [Malassezia yamatoensis]
MVGVRVPASFYRGGTSRGLLFRAADLAPYAPSTRDAIICAAMGSPDPDGRQIDGLGGGVSSLSKAAMISKPGKGFYTKILRELGDQWKLPGVEWADDAERAAHPRKGWDIVYRFGQVPINSATVDWGSTCGNMLAAVGLFALHNELVDPAFFARKKLKYQKSIRLPIRILMAATGKRATVTLPLDKIRRNGVTTYDLSRNDDTSISGVPGQAPGIQVSIPLDSSPLPTGNMRDTLEIHGKSIPVTIADAGIPTIFVHASDIGVSTEQMVQSAAALDQDQDLHKRIETLRRQAAQLTPKLAADFCSSAPKVVLVHAKSPYTSSAGNHIAAEDMDLLVRPISVGQFHRSIMATALSAIAVANAFPDSIVREASNSRLSHQGEQEDAQFTINVGHAAGTASATVQLDKGRPTSIVFMRTARRIMEGSVDIPWSVAQRWGEPYADYFERSKRLPYNKP